MHRLLLPLGSVLFVLAMLTHIGACIAVRISASAPGLLPDWLVSLCSAFVAI